MKKHPSEKRCANPDCNGTFKQFKSTVKVCSMECAITLAKVKRERKERREWKKRKSQLKAELLTVQDLIKVAQATFNTWIRNRDEGKPCISCGCKLVGKFDAGHYHNANHHWSVRFSELNVHGQCTRCNQWLHGNLIQYRVGLLNRIGQEKLNELNAIAKETRKYDRSELKSIIEKYKIKKK